MCWMKLSTSNNPIYINVNKLYKMEFKQITGELWLYFTGVDEPTKIYHNAKNTMYKILDLIDSYHNKDYHPVSESSEIEVINSDS